MIVIIGRTETDSKIKACSGRSRFVQLCLVVEECRPAGKIASKQIRFRDAKRDIGACLRQIERQADSAAGTKEVALINTEQDT